MQKTDDVRWLMRHLKRAVTLLIEAKTELDLEGDCAHLSRKIDDFLNKTAVSTTDVIPEASKTCPICGEANNGCDQFGCWNIPPDGPVKEDKP